jgi:hypothetical protein
MERQPRGGSKSRPGVTSRCHRSGVVGASVVSRSKLPDTRNRDIFILLNREFRGFLIIFDDICPPEQLEAVLARGAVAVRRRYWWQVCRSVVAFSRQILQGALLVRELLRKLGF